MMDYKSIHADVSIVDPAGFPSTSRLRTYVVIGQRVVLMNMSREMCPEAIDRWRELIAYDTGIPIEFIMIVGVDTMKNGWVYCRRQPVL